NLDSVLEELKAYNVQAHGELADVSDGEAVTAAMQRTADKLGPIRFLHNNAGPPSSVPLEFSEGLVISVGSMQKVTEAWIQHRPDANAAMVITSSVAGNLVGTDSNWYSASKAALMGYVRHLAAHHSDKFRSNAVAPGMTLTPRIAPFAESEKGKEVLQKIPLKRMASPEDIANATLFLLSPAASYINGVF